ncbi:hypothetical protein LTR62_002026 [Meristemomyces frigidus]|uniref:Hydrophobin n=1 Tax=Meristemomyces frigidus TaxID=1508187 RepID=A0AAN7TFX3_9PEZI|nr:hypothetical protein LTR62_002026 [Meristemomyces frigidus]
MRLYTLPAALLLATTTTALQLPSLDFHLPLSLNDYLPPPPPQPQPQNSPNHDHDLLRRQNSGSSSACPSKYNSCSALGAPGLCCAPSALCSADAAGNVACCPSGAACSGVISGVITAGTVSNGVIVAGGAGAGSTSFKSGGLTTSTSYIGFQAASSTTSGGGLVQASGTAATATGQGQGQSTVGGGSGFVIDGSSTVATPGAGMRRAEVPFVARALLRMLEYLPV